MRQNPIEITMTGITARKRLAEKISHRNGLGSIPEPSVIDEAFAGLDAIETPRTETGDGRIMKRALVDDLAAQLAAIDRQRERLVRLLESVESNTIAE